MLVWWTNPDESASNSLPACTRERGHGVDVLADHLPVHNRLCFFVRHRVGDIGATHRQRSANNYSENQVHVTFPQGRSQALVGHEGAARDCEISRRDPRTGSMGISLFLNCDLKSPNRLVARTAYY
jgi:hypothetical protein